MTVKKPPIPLVNESAESGWVERQTVRNQIAMMVRKIEDTLPTSERWPVRALVLDLVLSLEHKILAHSKSTEEIIAQARLMRPSREIQPDQREAHQARLAAMKGRQ